VFERFSPRNPVAGLAPLTAAACLLVTIACGLAWFAATSSAQTCGSKLCLDISHSPANVSFVSPNSLVTYTVTVTNPGPNTATKVVVRDQLATGTTLVSTPPSGCSAPSSTGLITCSLGSVKPTGGTPRVLKFTVQMPAFATSTSNVASISSDARANDSGNNPNDPTSESFSDAPEVVEVKATEDLANSDLPNGIRLRLNTDYDNTGATLNDPQTAKFTLLNRIPNGFSTTAVVDDDVPDAGFVCPTGLKCPTGGWVQGVVPGPLGLLDPFAPPSEFKIEIRHDASQIPPGLTASKYVLLHDNPALTDYEQITRRCSSNAPPCIDDVKKLADGDFLITAQVNGNFRWR
jgi:uncharacterized repeat protein (TIGR01451 family)